MPIPFNKRLGSVPLTRFTGHVDSGMLEDSGRSVFFSPALTTPASGTEIDVSNVQVRTFACDTYSPPQPATDNAETKRPFLFGPPPAAPSGRPYPPDVSVPSYVPVLNDSTYALMSVKPGTAIRGELLNTTTMQLDVLLV